jgi:S1-C subfamily serine protease
MMTLRTLCAALVPILTLGCAQGLGPPATPGERAALVKARDLHWVVESGAGAFITSATAFGPGRLLTSAHALEDWVGQTLRVRQGHVVHPVTSLGLAVREDVAVLRVEAEAIAVPGRAVRPEVNDRLIVAGATRHGSFSGAGVAAPPPRGLVFETRQYLAAWLPVLRGFSGAPVVDGNGDLVGIVMSAVIRRHIDPPDLAHDDPFMVIGHRTVLVIPNNVVDTVLRDERL